MLDKLFLRLLRYRKIPIVYTAHNLLPHNDVQEKQLEIYKNYYRLINSFIVHTEVTKKELCSKFEVDSDSVFVNKHGILPSIFNESEVTKLQGDYTDNYSLKGKIVFSSIGFQSYYKGLDFIIDFWKKEMQGNKSVHLFIAGCCRYDRVYELLEQENVTIIDRLLTKEELVVVSRLSSVILIPYRRISQSGILMTAMNDQIPVLISNVGGLPEPLQIADVGWNMGKPTLDNFEKTMNHILKHSEEIKMKKNDQEGWTKVKEAYDWKNIAKKTEEVYFATMNDK